MLTLEKMTYSYSALRECADLVKKTNWTVATKKEHFSKCFEIQKVFDFCLEKTGCMLFESDYSAWKDYEKRVNVDVEHGKVTKKELDQLLKDCYLFVCRELNGILTMMASGEVNAID